MRSSRSSRSAATRRSTTCCAPPPAWTERPSAKDDLRAKARELRAQGRGYDQIAVELGVSKSSVSLWVRDLPRPQRTSSPAARERQAAGRARYWAAERQRREAARAAISAAAADRIAELTDREILIAGAIAYWCEGAKNKPYRRTDRVDFINSDPQMIKFFLRFLETAGISRESLILGVSIHESADVGAAEKFWMEVTGVDPSRFNKPLIKRHNPRTVRKNTGTDSHGCLRIQVRRSTNLYRQIEGWARAAMAAGAGNEVGAQ